MAINEEAELPYWLWLHCIPGVGPVTFRNLLDHFGTVKAVWQANASELAELRISEKITKAILGAQAQVSPEALLISCLNSHISPIPLISPKYPALLKEIYDPPPILYTIGTFPAHYTRPIAIIGTRKMTNYGKTVTEKLTAELVAEGFTIISGLARGVDSTAHKTTLNSNGQTIAVLGGGLKHIYPPEHRQLAQQIANGHGLILSEAPPDAPATAGNFPARNRIISGLSLGVVVTEAAEQSGTMITVASALDQNRDVFAVPGPITSHLSVGTMKLIKQGATLVTCAQDIVEALGLEGKSISGPTSILDLDRLSDSERSLVCALQIEPYTLDDLMQKTGLSSATTLSTLTSLELQGLVNHGEDSLWQLEIGHSS